MGRTVVASAEWAIVSLILGTHAAGAQSRSKELERLVTRLHLSDRGVDDWLQRLGSGAGAASVERLLVVSPFGEVLAERTGDARR